MRARGTACACVYAPRPHPPPPPPQRYNQLSGPLPWKVGNPTTLMLGYNTFTNTIPASWGTDMKSLQLVNLE